MVLRIASRSSKIDSVMGWSSKMFVDRSLNPQMYSKDLSHRPRKVLELGPNIRVNHWCPSSLSNFSGSCSLASLQKVPNFESLNRRRSAFRLSGSHGTCHHQTRSWASSPLHVETWSLKFWKLDGRLLAPMWRRFTLKWLAKSKWWKTATKLKLLSWRVNRRSMKLHSFTLGWRYVSRDLIKIIAHYISGGCYPSSIRGPRRLRLAPFHHCTVHKHKSGIGHLKQLLWRAGMEDGRGEGKVSCPQYLPHHLQLTSTTQCDLPCLAGPRVPQTAHSPTHSIPMPSPLPQRHPRHNVPPPNHVQNRSMHNSMWTQQRYPHPAVNLFTPWTTACLEVRKRQTWGNCVPSFSLLLHRAVWIPYATGFQPSCSS